MRQRKGERILGPYETTEGGWKIVAVGADRVRSHQTFASEAAAEREADRLRRQLATAALTVMSALDAYAEHRRSEGNREKSIDTTMHRLRRFLGVPPMPRKATPEERDRVRAARDAALAQSLPGKTRMVALYAALAKTQAVDTHRNTLAEARTFFAWCAKPPRRWVPADLLADVEPTGGRSSGKPQLYVDEARRWLETAVWRAHRGDLGAVAAMTALLLGVRASEITARTVRELDDDGRLLQIPHGKTPNARRALRVPEVLRPYLLRAAAGKEPHDPLIGHSPGWLRKQVVRICRLAGVPRVTSHGLRGTHATLATDAGVSGDAVARSLGHESQRITDRAYVAPGGRERAQGRRVAERLAGRPARKRLPRESFPDGAAKKKPEQFRGAVGDRTPGL